MAWMPVDILAYFFPDHDCGQVGVGAGNLGHDRGIGDNKAIASVQLT